MDGTREQTAIAIRTEEDRVTVVDRARAMLERARTPVDAKQVHDLAKAAETYARLQKVGEEAVAHARAIAVDALTLMGEMLKRVEKATGAQGIGSNQHQKKEVRFPSGTAPTPTLADQGITKKQSMVAQSLATAKETRPELYEQVKAGAVSVTAAHQELKRPAAEPEATIAAVPDARPAPRPKHFKPGNNADPDHPFARTLKALTAVVKAFNQDIADDESGFLKHNLTLFGMVPLAVRQVVHGDDIWHAGASSQGAKFVGLAALRSVVRNSGRLKKKMTPAQLQKLCEQIGGASDEQLLTAEGGEQ